MAEEVKEEVIDQTPKGRSAIMEAYKASNPEMTEEPDDEKLHDFSHGRYSELEGKYNGLNGANTRLAELVAKDPKLGSVLSMISSEENPKSFPYAISKVYGKEPFGLEGDDLEEYESGHQDYLSDETRKKEEQGKANANFEKSLERLSKYAQGKSLDQGQLTRLYGGIMDLAEGVLSGNIPDEIFELVEKGQNYDKDVQEAADTGFVEGKSTKVEAKMREKTQPAAIPDLGNATGAGKTKQLPKQKKGSFYDAFKEEQV
jgi:hypothetical protein